MQWYPKVCWIHLFNSCTAYTFSPETFMEQAFTEPSAFFPFVDSKEANPTNFISISSLFCPLSLPQLSDVLCSLFLSSSHLFFLSVEKGKEMWIYVLLGTWTAFCAENESSFFTYLAPQTGTFLWAWVLFLDVDPDCLRSIRGESLWLRTIWNPPPIQVLFVVFLMIVILTEGRFYVIVILICISLIISNIEHFYICLLAICMSSLKKGLFRSSAHFWIALFVFLVLSCISCLYTLEINPLLVALFLPIL